MAQTFTTVARASERRIACRISFPVVGVILTDFSTTDLGGAPAFATSSRRGELHVATTIMTEVRRPHHSPLPPAILGCDPLTVGTPEKRPRSYLVTAGTPLDPEEPDTKEGGVAARLRLPNRLPGGAWSVGRDLVTHT